MVRQIVIAAVVGLCCAARAATADEKPSRNNDELSRMNEDREAPARGNDEVTRTTLHQIIDLKLDDTPQTDAIDRLRDQTGVRLFVNWKALEAAGVGRRDPVSLQIRHVHASTALDLLLRVASPEGPKLAWTIDDGVVNVSTATELSKNVMIRVYDIRDLLAGAGDRDKKVKAVIKFLTDRIDPASWKEHGGNVASLRELQGQLIVTQTAQNHREIIDLLQSLRPLFGAERGSDAFPILSRPK